MVEAGLARAGPVVRLDPAGKGHEEESAQLGLRPEAARDLEPVEAGQSEIENRDVGFQSARRVDAGRTVVRTSCDRTDQRIRSVPG